MRPMFLTFIAIFSLYSIVTPSNTENTAQSETPNVLHETIERQSAFIKSMQQRYDDLYTLFTSKTNQITRAKHHIASLQSELEIANTRTATAEQALSQIGSECNVLKRQNQEFLTKQQDIDELSMWTSAILHQNRTLCTKIKDLELQSNALKQRNQELLDRQNDQDEFINSARTGLSENQTLRAELEHTQQRLAIVAERRDTARKQAHASALALQTFLAKQKRSVSPSIVADLRRKLDISRQDSRTNAKNLKRAQQALQCAQAELEARNRANAGEGAAAYNFAMTRSHKNIHSHTQRK